eukprot:g20838.t1
MQASFMSGSTLTEVVQQQLEFLAQGVFCLGRLFLRPRKDHSLLHRQEQCASLLKHLHSVMHWVIHRQRPAEWDPTALTTIALKAAQDCGHGAHENEQGALSRRESLAKAQQRMSLRRAKAAWRSNSPEFFTGRQFATGGVGWQQRGIPAAGSYDEMKRPSTSGAVLGASLPVNATDGKRILVATPGVAEAAEPKMDLIALPRLAGDSMMVVVLWLLQARLPPAFGKRVRLPRRSKDNPRAQKRGASLLSEDDLERSRSWRQPPRKWLRIPKSGEGCCDFRVKREGQLKDLEKVDIDSLWRSRDCLEALVAEKPPEMASVEVLDAERTPDQPFKDDKPLKGFQEYSDAEIAARMNKKLDSVVNLLSDEEGEVKMEVEEGDEAEAKKKKAPRKRAPAKRKAAEKPADTNEEEPSGMEEQSQNAEEIVWKPVSQEGIKAWEGKWVCQEPAQDATRSASKKNKLDENGEQRKSPLKSFARRQCPKSSPARERWLVVREFFRMEIKPRIVPCGESTAAWEALNKHKYSKRKQSAADTDALLDQFKGLLGREVNDFLEEWGMDLVTEPASPSPM